jgi:hypothetical protein
MKMKQNKAKILTVLVWCAISTSSVHAYFESYIHAKPRIVGEILLKGCLKAAQTKEGVVGFVTSCALGYALAGEGDNNDNAASRTLSSFLGGFGLVWTYKLHKAALHNDEMKMRNKAL